MNVEVQSPKCEVRSSNRTRSDGGRGKMECALATIPELTISSVGTGASYTRSSYHGLRSANCFDLTAIRLLGSHNRTFKPNNHLLPHDIRSAILERHIVVASSGVHISDSSVHAQSDSIAIVEYGSLLAEDGTPVWDVSNCLAVDGIRKVARHSKGTDNGSLGADIGVCLDEWRCDRVSSVLCKLADCASLSYNYHSRSAVASGRGLSMSEFILATL